MASYAKVLNNIVTQVIVAEPDFFNTFIDTSPGEWLETCYGAVGGKDLCGNPAIRKNYAGVGYSYDKTLDAFIPPPPYKKWVLDKETCLWNPPIPVPTDGKIYLWSDELNDWEEQPIPDTQTTVEILP